MITLTPLSSVTAEVLEDIRALMRELSESQETSVTVEHIEEVLAEKNAVLLAAKDGERIVGIASLYVFPKVAKRSAVLEDVVVLEEYRGQGIGEKLVRALIDEAKARGAAALSLTSRPARIAAHALYAKLGFKKQETVPFRLSL